MEIDDPKQAVTPVAPEGIRAWYERTTSKSRTAFMVATAISFCIMALMWVFSSTVTLAKLQTFNGALTVPLIGGLWIFAFIFMFLLPSREASFRGQEALESVGGKIEKALEKALPAIATIERVALQIEKDYPAMLARAHAMMDEFGRVAKKIEEASLDHATLVKDVRPVVESLKKIEARFDDELLDELRSGLDSLQRLSGTPSRVTPRAKAPEATPVAASPVAAARVQTSEPDLSVALSRIGKKKAEIPKVG